MSRRQPWRRRLPSGALAAPLASWLTEPGSLTARCQRQCREFRVRLLRSGQARALAVEGLGIGGFRPLSRVREVVLECDGVPVIFAHTTLSSAVRGRLGCWMAGLGTRSLGSLLFAFPGFRRGAIEFRRLDSRDVLYCRAIASAPGVAVGYLWARRSLHALRGQQVLVTEVFLPAIARLS